MKNTEAAAIAAYPVQNVNATASVGFNPSTKIVVDIAQEKFATISIYNANGQEVSSLWSGVLTDGSHSFTWNGTDQPSGLYFARLNIDGAVSSAKLMLIK